MTSILNFSPQKTLSTATVLKFYERRMKRLFPAYFLVIFLTLFVAGFFLISFDFDFLRTDALWATFFSTNLQSIFEKKAYFLLISDYKFFLHTWSLSVELQYYIITPFLIYGIYVSQHPLRSTFIIGCISLAFQVLTQEHETVSFGFVFSRVWQFLIGSFVFYLEQQRKSTQDSSDDEVQLIEDGEMKNSTKYSNTSNVKSHIIRIPVIISLFVITFMPALSTHFAYTILIRVIATVLAGVAMYIGWDHEPSFLSNACVYFGDISYSVYLIHWPVIILAKYMQFFEVWCKLCLDFIIFHILFSSCFPYLGYHFSTFYCTI